MQCFPVLSLMRVAVKPLSFDSFQLVQVNIEILIHLKPRKKPPRTERVIVPLS